jgi:hypothetical protein
MSWFKARLKRKPAGGMEPEARNSFGGLQQWCEHYAKTAMNMPRTSSALPSSIAAWIMCASSFPRVSWMQRAHDAPSPVHTCCSLLCMSPPTRAAITPTRWRRAENLLLNAYRQQCSGMPPFLSCDYTHRLNFEKYNVCVMGTTDPSQSFHFIAFAISSDESDKTHTYIFETVRAEVEAIVARRTAARQDI